MINDSLKFFISLRKSGCYTFRNLKLSYTPPRAKYEWKNLLSHAYTIVEFLEMIIL
jgi:hypothetical protein